MLGLKLNHVSKRGHLRFVDTNLQGNRPFLVSVGHKQGNMLSDLKFLRRFAKVTNVLLTEFQIRTMSHMATMSMWTNALFKVQIQVCQLVVEPRNPTDCVIHVGNVSSIACFYHWYLQHNLCYKEQHTFIFIENKKIQLTVKYEPRTTKTYWIRRWPQ